MSLEKEIGTILEKIESIGGTGKFPTGTSQRSRTGYRTTRGDIGKPMLDPETGGFAADRPYAASSAKEGREERELERIAAAIAMLSPDPPGTGTVLRDVKPDGTGTVLRDTEQGAGYWGPPAHPEDQGEIPDYETELKVEEPKSAIRAGAKPTGYDTVNILGRPVQIPRYVDDVKDRKDPDALARGQSLPLPNYVPPKPEEQPSADTTQQTSGYSADNLPKTDIGDIKINGDTYRWIIAKGKYEKVHSKWDYESVGESIKYDLIRKTLMESNGTTPSTSSFMDKVKGGGKSIGKDILIYSVINWAYQKLFGDDAPEIEAPGRATLPTDLSQGALAKAKKLKGVPGVELPGGSRGNVVHGVKNIFRKRRAKEKRK
jgi:hypothetical protein